MHKIEKHKTFQLQVKKNICTLNFRLKHESYSAYILKHKKGTVTDSAFFGLFDVSCGFGFIQHAPHGAADQVDHRNEIAFVSVAASARSGSLKEAIHAFQTCVRQA